MHSNTAALKAVILVGGPQKGTRFRPLSLQLPKPLFPIAGLPLIEHHINQLHKIDGLDEIFLLGCFPASEFIDFVEHCAQHYPRITVHYLQEPYPLGTAGGLWFFKDKLFNGDPPKGVFVLNADICGDFPLNKLIEELELRTQAEGIILTTEATREQSINFGSVAFDPQNISEDYYGGKVLHYVDKPTTFVSTHISCGLYLLRPSVWVRLFKATSFQEQNNGRRAQTNENGAYHEPRAIWLESILPEMSAAGVLYAFHAANCWWSQTKTPASVLYANRHYLRLLRERNPQRLSSSPRDVSTDENSSNNKSTCEIVGDVFIDQSAEVHPSAKIGPNVSIGPKVKIGAGVRIRESIVLAEAQLDEHCCVLHSVIGWRSCVGKWARVEGHPIEPNPNVPFAKLENRDLFNTDGRLNPSLSILGSEVNVHRELMVLNSIVLPYKEITSSYRNQIIL